MSTAHLSSHFTNFFLISTYDQILSTRGLASLWGILHPPLVYIDAVADPGFSPGGAPNPKIAIIFQIFAENCMKMKKFGPPWGARPWSPPWIRQCDVSLFICSSYYRPQTKFEKVIFSQVSVCPQGEACIAGGMRVGGACMAEDHAWQGDMHGSGGGHAWQGACMTGEMATAASGTHPTAMHSCKIDHVFIMLVYIQRICQD